MLDKESERLKGAGVLSEFFNSISLTDRGRALDADLHGKIDGEILLALGEYKRLLNDLSYHELLAFIHSMFPGLSGDSAEYENVRKSMEPLIMSLIEKEKISPGRGAELLGISLNRVIQNMHRMGIQVYR
ncbi:MAG: hypothetical protein MPI95_03900 [Nitrosopumilus sp.]|nr:hypothetical protein [Nitrosopumilus sp.]